MASTYAETASQKRLKSPRPSRQTAKVKANPIQTAIQSWIAAREPARGDDGDSSSSSSSSWAETLLNTAPKRFTIYEPLALLPAGSFTNEAWASALRTCGEDACASLWSSILEELSKDGRGAVTHLAVNEGIPLRREGEEAENVQRSPSGLRMLFGDFGPAPAGGGGGGGGQPPAAGDFDGALWVATKQNGIHQTWAPRWTMFSRGNVKEKARLLGFGKASQEETGEEPWAVDLYAGIGYFTFCYAALGMRVLCWEINPWSVEGLRRGARANRWSVRVVQGDELRLPLEDLMAGGEQIVVFLESNQEALRRVRELQQREPGLARNVRHVNCGFLPTSEPTWEHAWEMTRWSAEAWLHLHENVGVDGMEARRRSIRGLFEGWASAEGNVRTADAEHIEQVKTFAPGVWHCVFDVHITRSNATT